MPALSTSEPRPNVTIVSGSAMRVTSGHRTALMSAIAAATSTAAPKESDSSAGQQRRQHDQRQRLDPEQDQRP